MQQNMKREKRMGKEEGRVGRVRERIKRNRRTRRRRTVETLVLHGRQNGVNEGSGYRE